MKILIIVPDGVGVRNYLYSSFVDLLLENNNEVIIYHKLSNSAIEEIKSAKPALNNFIEIPHFLEKPNTRLIRESLAFARLVRNKNILKNNSILKFWNPSKKGIKKKLLYFLARLIGTVLSKSIFLITKADLYFDYLILKSSATKINKVHLRELSPSFILNLHQRSSVSSPVISAAKSLNIKTGTVIFSWDNVPKARLISRYNYYFVWSQLMKQELLLLYPEIQKETIKVTGSPQFEFYFKKEYHLEKQIFFKRYGLDLKKQTICFSGNDASSPYEANYLLDICEEISKINEDLRPQILFRKCPVDKSNRFDAVLEKYKNLVFSIDPDWQTAKSEEDSFISIYPTYNDIQLLVNTVKHSDVVVNLGSTMAHDFAILNKPCLYLNYNPVSNSTFKVEDIYNFQHFRSMQNIDAVGWVNGKQYLLKQLLLGLNDPLKVGKEREKWLETIVLHPVYKNSEILSKKIIECI